MTEHTTINIMATKRISIALLSIFLTLTAFAASKDLEKDITMVSYEQGWLDYNGTLALKNNTSKEIKNVVFLITYLDMSGKELDYEEFSKSVSIAPGMTKKLDIPAYEHERSYHYYKSENRPLGSPAFKIKFKLKDYSVEEESEDSIDGVSYGKYDYESSTDYDGITFTIAFILLFVIGITVGLYVLVAVMAQNRNRSVVVWLLLSFIATPLLMIFILLIIGNNNNYNGNHYDRK